MKGHNALPLLGWLFDRAICIAAVAVPFVWLDRFDWNNPFTKLISFSVLGIAAWLGRSALRVPVSTEDTDRVAAPAWLDMLLGISMLIAVVFQYDIPSAFMASDPRFSDMGAVTHDAARRLLLQHANPYHGHYSNAFEPGYGYSYGPVTILGHAIAVVSAQGWIGMRIANLLLLWVCGVLVAGLAYRYSQGSTAQKIGASLFALGLMALPYRIWFEPFIRCSSDLLEPILFLAALLCGGSNRWLLAGLWSGLAFGSKMVFGIISAVTLVRRCTPWRFFFGAALGLTPVLAMLAADPAPFCEHFFSFQLTKSFDNTSLYMLTPAALHWLFPTIRSVALGFCLVALWRKRVSVRETGLVAYLLLLLLCATNVEVHGNHLVWIVPLAALVMTWERGAFARLLIDSRKSS